jgi:hypothetical protein
MISTMKKLIGVFAVVLPIAVLVSINFGCAVCHHYVEMNGLLLDTKDGKPIQGAAVVGVYLIEHGTVGGEVDESVDARETTTDSGGRFLLPGKLVCVPRLPFSGFSKQPRIYIFAPNYESVFVWKAQAYQGKVYEFRVSRLETDNARKGNAAGVVVYEPAAIAAKFPNFLNLVNAERRKYGMPEIYVRKQ